MRKLITHLRNLDAEDYAIITLTALSLITLYYATEYALTVTIG